ncbi:hypothetical protein F2P81_024061 [Scophthalmus maximus]|uniref:Uncharacterized protein n=1 Tax=Scophthalmus maximus TaxID=52904 RepID=A0A6A4RWG0_SCOMX|nr:hypothetical protein F2P81_024061 [Scophthalmus maximus]
MGDAASLRSRKSGRGFYSDSGEDDYARSADRNSSDVDLRYKRALCSSSSNSERDTADRQGQISRPSKRIKKQESLSVALRDANKQQGHRLFPGGKGTKVKSKVVQLKPPGHSNLIRSKRCGEGFSPERPRPSSPQASNVTRSIKSSPFKKPKGVRVEEKEKQRRRAPPGAGKTRFTTHRETRPGASTKSGSDSESQEDQEPPSRKLRNTTSGDTETAPSGTKKSNRRHAWIESESEVGSDNGEGYAKSAEGPIREDVERMSGESSLSDSSAESEEYKDRRGSCQAKHKRPDPPRESTKKGAAKAAAKDHRSSRGSDEGEEEATAGSPVQRARAQARPQSDDARERQSSAKKKKKSQAPWTRIRQILTHMAAKTRGPIATRIQPGAPRMSLLCEHKIDRCNIKSW